MVNINPNQSRFGRLAIAILVAMSLGTHLSAGNVRALTNSSNTQSMQIAENSLTTLSNSTNSILRDVVRQMEPALTNFLSTYSSALLNSTIVKLESKYKTNKLSIDWDISSDAKLFVVVKVDNKQYCYQGTGEYRIKLVKSKRCR